MTLESTNNQLNKKELALSLGKFGEDLACEYLVKKGYKIIERNFRRPWGELDIVAKTPDKTLIFVEVKTVSSRGYNSIQPEEQLTKFKLQKLKKTACLYVGHNTKLIKDNKGWQIDLIALTINEKGCDIKHYENII